MNSKWHLYTSFIKSGIRIFGCGYALTFGGWQDAILALILAEIFGLLEEWKDDR